MINENTDNTITAEEDSTRPGLESKRQVRPRLHRPGFIREVINSLFFIVAALVLSELALPRSSLDGPSMQPNLWAGQHLLISRIHYLFGDPQHEDIAVFEKPTNPDEMLIKRVIGVPGDTIELRDRLVYRNGELLDEPYFINKPCEVSSCNDETWELGENEYFLMGDNRNRSNDSRSFDAVPRENIVGKALFRYWPLDEFGSLYNVDYNEVSGGSEER